MKLGKAKRIPPRPPSPDEQQEGDLRREQSAPSFPLSSSPPQTSEPSVLSSPSRSSSTIEFTSPTRRKQNLEPGDDEEFEIMDFHLASSWERFIASIEKALRAWGLHNGGTGETHRQQQQQQQPLVQTISYAHRQYQLSFHLNSTGIESPSHSSSFFFSTFSPFSTSLSPSLRHMMDLEGDFPSRAHHLTRWFGVREFLIIAPLSDVGADLSEASLLLSSLTIATQNSSCYIPVFVPVKERWKGVYIGYCAWNGLTTHLESECLPSIPSSFISQSYLSALMKSFASKLGTVGDPNEKISLSMRQTHMKQGYGERNWRTCLLNVSPPNFPWGPSADPIEALHLALSWKKEFEYWSEDGLPFQVPEEQPLGGFERSKWLLRCIYNDKLQYLLTRCVQNVLQAYAETENLTSMEEITPPSTMTETATGPKLLNAVETFTRSITAGWNSLYLPTPAEVEAIVRDIFDPSKQMDVQGGDMYLPVKSVPPGSLVADLVLSLLNMAGLKAFAMVWTEFKRVVRNHWERAIPLPRISPLPIDFRTCLLYQKLQMINHCIAHERLRLQSGVTDPELPHSIRTEPKPFPQTDSGEDLSEKGEEDPDEWKTGEGGWDFDDDPLEEIEKASEDELKKDDEDTSEKADEEEQPNKTEESTTALTDTEGKPLAKREGVKPNYDTGLRLLKTGEPLFAPLTQEHAVMTEDMIMEQEELFTNQDTDAIRHHMSKTLLSDMEAFKAANPDCLLEDFVRWYSPNDWHQADPKAEASLETGQLSKRMKEPGNLWQKSWEDAQPVPIIRQKPLFNHRTEGEKVLHYLDNISPGELIGQFLMIALTTIHHRLFILPSAGLEIVAKAIDRFGDVLKETGNTGVQEQEVILRSLVEAEALSARATSLLDKLGRRQSLVAKLLADGESELGTAATSVGIGAGETERQLAIRFISPDNGRLPEPDARELILRAWVPRPFPGSRNVPNRLYALITNYEFRVATVTSLDE